MYPTFASFKQDPKPLQFRIPPYNISLHTLQFQHQIMIPNPVKPTNYPAEEANCEDSNGRKCERQDSGQNEDFIVEDGPGQYGLHGGGEDGMENMGIGFVSQYPQQIMDGFGVDVSSGGEYRKEGSENAMGAVTAAERRHRRMIKNRESAARSRARKQAYTSQLEIEVGELKMENALLKKRRKCSKGREGEEEQASKHPKDSTMTQHLLVLEDIAATAPAQPQEVPQKAHSAAF